MPDSPSDPNDLAAPRRPPREDGRPPRLLGVMVTFRRPVALAAHLTRLGQQTRPLDGLVIIDNDAPSTSDEVAALVADHDEAAGSLRYRRSEANLGPAGGIARGMEWAIEGAADNDWLVLLDDDDPPATDDILEQLVALADELLAGELSAGDRAGAVERVGGVGVIGSRFDRVTGRLRRFPDDELHGFLDVDYLGSNQFPMYRVGAVRATGVFEPSLFWGYDDLDYGLRMRRAGFRLVISGALARQARAHYGHLEGDGPAPPSSTSPATHRRGGRGVAWRRYYTTRNLIHVLRKHGLDGVALRRATTAALIRPVRHAADDPLTSWAELALAARGVVDGWTDRMGPRVAPVAKPTTDDDGAGGGALVG